MLVGGLGMRIPAVIHHAAAPHAWRDDYLVGLGAGLILIAFGFALAAAAAVIVKSRRAARS